MHTEPLQVTPATLYLDRFKIEVPVLRVSGMGDYFPVRPFCTAIGLNSRPQVERIQADDSYAAGVETFTVVTAGGSQPAVCLRKRELAWWLASLEPRTVRKLEERFGIPLDAFKQAIMDASDALWWGVQSPTPREIVPADARGELFLECRRCKALHKFSITGGTFAWEIVGE